jgi:hypothetical protein
VRTDWEESAGLNTKRAHEQSRLSVQRVARSYSFTKLTHSCLRCYLFISQDNAHDNAHSLKAKGRGLSFFQLSSDGSAIVYSIFAAAKSAVLNQFNHSLPIPFIKKAN